MKNGFGAWLARVSLAGLIAVFLLALPAQASDDGDGGGHETSEDNDQDADQERVRTAVDRGEIKSLAVLRRIVLGKVSGDVVSVEFSRKQSRKIYEFRVLRPDGRLVELEIDAVTGIILQIENE
ncbi:MAG TPA: peptidase [Rhizobium sp.]|nr:peptidase [Rhizobium sp.]